MTSKNLVVCLAGGIVAALLVASCSKGDPAPTSSDPDPVASSADTSDPAPVPAPQETQTAPAVPIVDNNAKLDECRQKLKAAATLDLLKDMSFDNGRPRVVIGPTWYQVDFGAKEGFAQTAACFFLAGDGTKAIRFDLTDNMTGKVVATWSYTKLVVR